MFPHLLKAVLLQLHMHPSVHLLYDEVMRFSRQELHALTSAGILVPSSPAQVVICDECERRCTREMEHHTGPDGTSAFIRCPMRVDTPDVIPIPPERAEFWRASRTRLLSELRRLLNLSSSLHEIMPGRFWRLGTMNDGQRRIDVFFATGVHAKDFMEIWASARPAIEECSCPVLITPSEFAPPKTCSQLITVSLTRLMSLEEGTGLAIDVDEIMRVASIQPATAITIPMDFRFSADFTSVSLRDMDFVLSRPQAQVVRALYKARQNRTPWLSNDYLMIHVAESPMDRLRDVFKSKPEAWQTLILSDNKGNYRLNID